MMVHVTDQTFIDTLKTGNDSEVKSAIIDASSLLLTRLGHNSSMIVNSMPPNVLEWMKQTILISNDL